MLQQALHMLHRQSAATSVAAAAAAIVAASTQAAGPAAAAILSWAASGCAKLTWLAHKEHKVCVNSSHRNVSCGMHFLHPCSGSRCAKVSAPMKVARLPWVASQLITGADKCHSQLSTACAAATYCGSSSPALLLQVVKAATTAVAQCVAYMCACQLLAATGLRASC